MSEPFVFDPRYHLCKQPFGAVTCGEAEGDALAQLSTYHAGSLSKYNCMRMMFSPRPKDSYNLANAISVGANATWTVGEQPAGQVAKITHRSRAGNPVDEGGYEARSSRFSAGVAELMIEEGRKLLADLRA